MENSRFGRGGRNKYMLLIGAGVFLLLNKIVANPATMISLFMVLLGIYSLRTGSQKKGYVLLGIGTFVLVGSHLVVISALILMSLGFFYLRSKQVHGESYVFQRTRLIESQKRDKEPWVLRSMSLWCVVGEINLDFSLAIPEEKDTTLVLQGIIGDIDLYLPEDMDVTIESSVLFGQLHAATQRESGVMNKVLWQSPNYGAAEYRVKLIVSYIVGDIDIKLI